MRCGFEDMVKGQEAYDSPGAFRRRARRRQEFGGAMNPYSCEHPVSLLYAIYLRVIYESASLNEPPLRGA